MVNGTEVTLASPIASSTGGFVAYNKKKSKFDREVAREPNGMEVQVGPTFAFVSVPGLQPLPLIASRTTKEGATKQSILVHFT